MAYDAIRWGYQDSSGRQREADGGRLINLFPIETPDPASDKVPADLWNTPGAQTWMDSPLSGDITLQRNIPLGFALAAANDKPRGQWSDGTTLWVANAGAARTLFAYNLLSRTPDPSKNIPLGGTASSPKPTGLTGIGTNLLVAFEGFTGVHAFSMITMAEVGAENIATTQEDIVGVWADSDHILWALGKNQEARPYATTMTTVNLPAAFSLLSDGINRTPSGATRLTDGSIAIIDEATRDIFSNTVKPGGRDALNDFDFKAVYPDITSAFGFVNDSTAAFRVAAQARKIYAMSVREREAWPDRTINLPEGGTATYLFGFGDTLWVLITPEDPEADTYIAQFNSQNGEQDDLLLYPGGDVLDAQGIFSRGDFAWIADREQNKILRFKFGTVGVADPSRNIVLPPERDSPVGIWGEGENAYILDRLDSEIYGYFQGDGSPNPGIDFPLPDTPSETALGLWGSAQHFQILTSTAIEVYNREEGDKLPLLTIPLDPLNADPRGLYATPNNAYVLDNAARKIFAYLFGARGMFGQRNSALDKTPNQLLPGVGLEKPVGIGGIRVGSTTRIWVLGEDTGIYELEQDADGVLSRKANGADITNIQDNDSNDLAVYMAGGNLRILWADDDDNSIYGADMQGNAWGAQRQMFSASNPHGVAVDNNWIYTTEDGRRIVRFNRDTFARDSWSIEFSAHDIQRRARALFTYQERLWVVFYSTRTAHAFDIETREPVDDLDVDITIVSDPRGIWGDGRYMYVTNDQDSTTEGGIRGFDMASASRDPDRDVELHADNDDAYGLFATATIFYVGNRGTHQRVFTYSLLQRTHIEDGGFSLLESNSKALSMWGTTDGCYVLDENLTAYWYGFRRIGLVRDPDGDINCVPENANIAGLWGDDKSLLYAVDSAPGAIFAYDTETRMNLPDLQFTLDMENITNVPTGVWGNDNCVWVGAELNGKVYCYLRNAGASRGVLCPLTQRNASPYGIWSDADYHYVNDVETGFMYVYNVVGCQIALSDDIEDFLSNATWLAMIAIESPINGNHLFGVAQDVFFHFNPGPPFNDPEIMHTGKFTTYEEEQLSGPIKLTTDNRYIFITTPISIKIYDVLTREFLEEMPDPILPRASNLSAILRDEDWVASAWSDGYFLVGTRSGEVFHSNLHSLQFDQLDFARTEAYPDSLVSIEVYNRQVILFGSASIEQWYNSGDANLVFRRNYSFTVNIGAAAQAAISVDIQGVFFLATNGIVYHFTGGITRVSIISVEESISESDESKATSFIYTEQGQRFYVLTLDIGGTKKTWAMHIDTGLWHERTISDIRAYVTFQKRHITSRPAGLDEMSTGIGSDHAIVIHREAIIPALQANRARQYVHALEVEIPFRAGGDATDRVSLDWSYDGGETFTPAPGLTRVLPDSERARLRWNRLGGGERTRNFRLSIDATRPVNILGAYIDYEPAEA